MATFTDTERVEQRFNNDPVSAVIILEATITQDEADTLEAAWFPPASREAKHDWLSDACKHARRLSLRRTVVDALEAELSALAPAIEPGTTRR